MRRIFNISQSLRFQTCSRVLGWMGLFLGISQGLAQASFPLYTCYDATQYALEFKLSAETQRIAGTCRMHLTMTRNADRIQFDLAPSLRIARIQLGYRPVRFERSGSTVSVQFPQTLARGSSEVLEIVFGGMPAARQLDQLFGKDRQGRTQIRLSSALLSPSGWWPCKMQVADPVDSMRVEVIFDKGPQVLTQGKFLYQLSEPGGFQRSVFVSNNPTLPEELELYIGYFEKLSEIYQNDQGQHELKYYVPAGAGAIGTERLDRIRKSLSCLEAYFGTYPFGSSGLMWVDMGAPFSDRNWERYGVDTELVKTLSKEWWGKNIRTNLAEDAWIPQTFQTYATSLVIECQTDSKKALTYLHNLPESEKSALILHTLRSLTDNEEEWFAACRTLSSTFAERSISTEALVDFFQWKLNLDATNIFQQYLLYPSPPVLEYSIMSKGKKLTLAYRWNSDFAQFDMPVDILLKGKKERITPTTDWQSLTWKGVSNRHLQIDSDFGWFQVQQLEL